MLKIWPALAIIWTFLTTSAATALTRELIDEQDELFFDRSDQRPLFETPAEELPGT